MYELADLGRGILGDFFGEKSKLMTKLGGGGVLRGAASLSDGGNRIQKFNFLVVVVVKNTFYCTRKSERKGSNQLKAKFLARGKVK